MISTLELLAAAKQGAGIPSNYRLARHLDITDSAVQRWNTGRGAPDDAHAARLAEMAGLDVAYVVAAMRAAREKDERLRGIWQAMADRLKAAPLAGFAAVMLTLSTSGAPLPAQAAAAGDEGTSVRYVNQRRKEKALRASLGRAIKKARAH